MGGLDVYKRQVALREPSLGPCFGMKGGAAGGGYAQVLPMEKINLHFTGDFHAITSAHNMISALLDNYLYQNQAKGFGLKEILWRRVLDVNDRSLRSIVVGLGPKSNGITQESGFDITPASEIMAILCLSRDVEEDVYKRQLKNKCDMKRTYLLLLLLFLYWMYASAQQVQPVREPADSVKNVAYIDSLFRELPEVMITGERPVVKAEQGKLVYDVPRLVSNLPVDNAYDAVKNLPGVVAMNDGMTLGGQSVRCV